MRNLILIGLAGLLLLFSAAPAQAHGGDYIISEARGRYMVTATLSPAPMSVGRGDLSVAVRDSAPPYAPLPVERVLVRLIAADGAMMAYSASPEGPPADAIYGLHTLDFTSAGDWQVVVTLVGADQPVEFAATVKVAGAAWRWINVVIYLLPLLVLVALIGLAALRNRLTRPASTPALETNGD
jgi:hypothetical protein